MTEYYKEKLQQGLEFQDFVTNILIKELGIALSTYNSKKYQLKGENKQGIEIKFDNKHKETGNVYIEISEKSNPDNVAFVESGIYRDDNTWLYVIGNYKILYIFSKKFLKKLHETGKCREVAIPTSKGFLLTMDQVKKYCIKILYPNTENNR